MAADIPNDRPAGNGDERCLRQVLLNLVSNALKYSSIGSPIAISADVHDEEVTLCVRDQGLGVPPEEQQHLFDVLCGLIAI